MTVVAPLVIAGVIVCVALWVFADARHWERQGTPVVFRFGTLTISTPAAWAVACLVLFVIFAPIYAVARQSSAP